MRFCNIGSCINNDKVTDCSEFTLERYIERLPAYRAAGLTHVELSHLMALSTEDAVALRNACRDIGLSIWSIHSEHFNDAGGMSPGGQYEGGTLEQYFETQARCAETAQAASAKIFVCHLPNYTKQPRFDFERNLKIIELKEIAKRIYARFGIYIIPAAKFVVELIALLLIRNAFGYEDRVSSVPICLILAAIS